MQRHHGSTSHPSDQKQLFLKDLASALDNFKRDNRHLFFPNNLFNQAETDFNNAQFNLIKEQLDKVDQAISLKEFFSLEVDSVFSSTTIKANILFSLSNLFGMNFFLDYPDFLRHLSINSLYHTCDITVNNHSYPTAPIAGLLDYTHSPALFIKCAELVRLLDFDKIHSHGRLITPQQLLRLQNSVLDIDSIQLKDLIQAKHARVPAIATAILQSSSAKKLTDANLDLNQVVGETMDTVFLGSTSSSTELFKSMGLSAQGSIYQPDVKFTSTLRSTHQMIQDTSTNNPNAESSETTTLSSVDTASSAVILEETLKEANPNNRHQTRKDTAKLFKSNLQSKARTVTDQTIRLDDSLQEITAIPALNSSSQKDDDGMTLLTANPGILTSSEKTGPLAERSNSLDGVSQSSSGTSDVLTIATNNLKNLLGITNTDPSPSDDLRASTPSLESDEKSEESIFSMPSLSSLGISWVEMDEYEHLFAHLVKTGFNDEVARQIAISQLCQNLEKSADWGKKFNQYLILEEKIHKQLIDKSNKISTTEKSKTEDLDQSLPSTNSEAVSNGADAKTMTSRKGDQKSLNASIYAKNGKNFNRQGNFFRSQTRSTNASTGKINPGQSNPSYRRYKRSSSEE